MRIITRNRHHYVVVPRRHINDQWCMKCKKFSLDAKGFCVKCGFTYVYLYSQIPRERRQGNGHDL